jgi:hypothetical protein
VSASGPNADLLLCVERAASGHHGLVMKSNIVHARWTPAPGVCASQHDNGLVLLHAITNKIFTCNRSGARIWDRLSSGSSAEAIARDLADTYRLGPDQITRDVVGFLASLERSRLIERHEGRP